MANMPKWSVFRTITPKWHLPISPEPIPTTAAVYLHPVVLFGKYGKGLEDRAAFTSITRGNPKWISPRKV
jgi:hypothetical protein